MNQTSALNVNQVEESKLSLEEQAEKQNQNSRGQLTDEVKAIAPELEQKLVSGQSKLDCQIDAVTYTLQILQSGTDLQTKDCEQLLRQIKNIVRGAYI